MRVPAGWMIAVALMNVAIVPSSARADDESKEALIHEMLELTGAGALGHQVLSSMLASFASSPNANPALLEKVKELARPEELLAMMIPIYMEHFDEATLAAATRFYKTPEGKKLIEGMPAITAAAMDAGREWGEQLATDAIAAIAGEQPSAPAAPPAAEPAPAPEPAKGGKKKGRK